MEGEIQQLVEMGATTAQARAALKQYRDVMQAAERIFEGKFDHVMDEDPQEADPVARLQQTTSSPAHRMTTPDEDQDEDEEILDDDDEGDYVDYDSDDDFKADPGNAAADVDPYSGIFFSKDRREEVIEVEEEPISLFIPEWNCRAKIMSQGEWMKGCPEGGEQSFLFSLYSQLSDGECPCPHGCGASVRRKKSDFFAMPELDFAKFTARLSKIVLQTCQRCSKDFCLACGESINAETSKRPSVLDDDPLFHCSNLQGVILGIGLSMIEELYSEQTRHTPVEQDYSVRNAKRRKVDSQPTVGAIPDGDDDDDVYYASAVKGKKNKSGIGYAGDMREDNTGQVEAIAQQRLKDEKLGQLLTAVRVYLPSLRRLGGGRTSDYLVHPTALAHLRRRFNHICSSLLKNDSLTDMSDRSVLYLELFDWLETISNHEALASMMAMPIMVVVSTKVATPKRAAHGGVHIRERTIIYEGSSGPRELLESVVIQAKAAIKGLEGMKVADSDEEEMTEEDKRLTNDSKGKAKAIDAVAPPDDSSKLLAFCRRILSTASAIDRFLSETKGDAFVHRLHAALPKIPSSSQEVHVDAGATEESAKKAYMEWATQVRFEYCDLTIPVPDITQKDNPEVDQTPNYKFYYNNEARMLANSDIPKRSLAIAKELAVLTTNLPVAWDSSIFLRVDETRVDIIKALITGPEGTPYHNGCYMFDIFLGPSYNQQPPSVKYMTTNGGKYRFNPNLYADGKVCLSLLGTWQGPGWVSGKSTLLQVLISIQSMILCEEPYLNEPGWANSAGTPQSHAYSANVRRMVVKTAMLGNLKNPPDPFREIIRTHYRLKAVSIMAQLDRWLAQDDGKPTAGEGGGYSASKVLEAGGSSNGLQKDVEEMKEILKQLQRDSGGRS
ncbi:hypothetical protein JAAARDRAFT_28107 [Jaapia argillacea MUCL 33604]|uniref:UBC core domain-containing protein n=1 Tax=Jaapia argillacea MUCL 33604 TaxID=933084 RepID=A0A067QEA3_9AGAM|nr:hypothetical protein JAAARDRAFT_28107 [Jaapia argillacea MUCL 33604]